MTSTGYVVSSAVVQDDYHYSLFIENFIAKSIRDESL